MSLTRQFRSTTSNLLLALWDIGGRSANFGSDLGRRRVLILIAGVLVVAYALGVLGYVMTTPDIGTRTAFTPVVNHFLPDFLDPPDQEPLRQGDRIVEVAGRRIVNWSQMLRELLNLDSEQPRQMSRAEFDATRSNEPGAAGYVRVGDTRLVSIIYERGGVRHTAWCRISRPPLATLLPSVLWFVLKIGLFAVGAVVYWKRPNDLSAGQFFLFCTLGFGAYMGGYHWSRIVTQPVLLVAFICCGVLLPAVSLHFYLVFPRPKAFLERRRLTVLSLLYGPSLLFLILLLSDYGYIRWLYMRGGEGIPAKVEMQLERILGEVYLYFGIAVTLYLLSIVCLIHSYAKALDATERNQVKWLLVGELAALGPICYSLYLAVAHPDRFGGGGATWPMFAASACVTLAFTISITRYRLMQLDQLVSSGFWYFLISCVVAGLYYAVVLIGMFAMGSQFGEPSLFHAIGVATTALLLMVALDLARGRAKAVLDRHFHREKHQLDRTWQKMSQAIEQLVDPATLARRLLHTAGDLLGVRRGAIYLRQGDAALYALVDHLGAPPTLTELSSGCPLVESLRGGGMLTPRPGTPPDGSRRQLQLLGGSVAHALWHEGQLLGLLLLGPRETGGYGDDDLHVLSAFSQMTVMALVSAEGRRAIETLNRELHSKVEKIAEQQRRILTLQSQLQRGASSVAATSVEHANGSVAPAEQHDDHVIGSGKQVRQLMQLVRKVAASDSAVLLRGESGTGKELLARALHENSPRAGKAFIKVHCAALSPTLLASELFGHVKGAFTNAIRDKVGRFEAADGGTLFLDEIGDIGLDVQIKLLRVLQEKTFERVGSSEPVSVDVRVVAATHQDLERLIKEGRFREDLFYRLNVLPIRVPPLRERVEDIPELAQHFLRTHSERTNRSQVGLDDDALTLLKGHHWPGNVRELENVLERAAILADGGTITAAELPAELHDRPNWLLPSEAEPATDADMRSQRERRERELLVRALAGASGNKAEAARSLGVARSTLLSRLKRLGLG